MILVSEIQISKGLQCRLTINDSALKFYLEIQIVPYTLNGQLNELSIQGRKIKLQHHWWSWLFENSFIQYYSRPFTRWCSYVLKRQITTTQRGIISTIENQSTAIKLIQCLIKTNLYHGNGHEYEFKSKSRFQK